jgi:hypothetical protein
MAPNFNFMPRLQKSQASSIPDIRGADLAGYAAPRGGTTIGLAGQHIPRATLAIRYPLSAIRYPLSGAYGPYGGSLYWGAYTVGGWGSR